MVSIPAYHAGDRGSIPRRGEISFFHLKNVVLARPRSPLLFLIKGFPPARISNALTVFCQRELIPPIRFAADRRSHV